MLSHFISEDEVPRESLKDLCDRSYGGNWRSAPDPCPNMYGLEPNVTLLELFHGPTFAFKDAALQFLGNLFPLALAKFNKENAIVLGATSGDTGSAAVAGVRGKSKVNAVILYPNERVSRIQELQMLSFNTNGPDVLVGGGAMAESTNGGVPNVVNSCAVDDASFDDCQGIVKEIFQDKAFVKEKKLLAVNSINVARVLAQMVYYAWSYFRLLDKLVDEHKQTYVELRDTVKVRFAVPTGNFGDVLAGYYCKKYFGALFGNIFELTVASNSNDILTRFFETGKYQVDPKGVAQTLSPSMDIQVSSNFERFLLDVLDGDCVAVKEKLEALKEKGVFEVSGSQLERARREFGAFAVSEEATVGLSWVFGFYLFSSVPTRRSARSR